LGLLLIGIRSFHISVRLFVMVMEDLEGVCSTT
jgi:hypothetical protein